jgi:hypothetical protein
MLDGHAVAVGLGEGLVGVGVGLGLLVVGAGLGLVAVGLGLGEVEGLVLEGLGAGAGAERGSGVAAAPLFGAGPRPK